MLFVGELFARLGEVAQVPPRGGRPELGGAEAGPHRLHRLEGMGQVDVFRGLEGALVEFPRSEEQTSELQSLMRNSYAVLCLKKKIIKMNIEQEYTIAKTNRQPQ